MLGNWILQTTTTTGTGSLELATVTGFPAASTQFPVGQLLSYTILDNDTSAPIERGIGRLDGTGKLERARPAATMVAGVYAANTPAAVSLAAGVKRVICSPGADSYDTVPGPATGLGISGNTDMHPVNGGSFNIAVAADTVYMIPFKRVFDREIVAFVFRMPGTSGAGGTTAKIAAYSVGLDGLPGAKLAESAAVSVSGNGLKTCTVTPFRPPSRFFVAFLTDGAPVLSQQSGSANGECWLGMSGTMAPFTHLTQAATGVTFPATWALAGALFNTNRPTIVAQTA